MRADIDMHPLGLARADTLLRLLARAAERCPDAHAILAPRRAPLRFHQLLRHIRETISALNDLGLGPADRVALALPEGPELAVALLATASGAAAAPLDPASPKNEAAVLLRDLKADALIVPNGTDVPARRVAVDRGLLVIELTPAAQAEAGRFVLNCAKRERPPIRASLPGPDDVAVLLHTSGTTGRPLLAPLTQANICASAWAFKDAFELSANDRCLNLMRMYHISFLGNLIASLAAGGSVICPPGFQADQFFAWLDELGPTWYMAVPTMHRAIRERAAAHADAIARSRLRFVRSGAATLPADLASELEEMFGAPVTLGYGMTEASPLVTAVPLPPRRRKPGSVGIAAGTEIAIMGEGGEVLPPELPGEIIVRGPNVFHGYDGDEAANREAFTADGWFRTGDLGYLDDDGFLFLVGRLKELINRGGTKIAPQEVEGALLAHPSVCQAVAFAMPDERLGEDVAAVVVLRPGFITTEAELRRFVAHRLAPFKVPRRVVFADDLPTSPTGKIRRVCLAEELGLLPASTNEIESPHEFVAPRTPIEEVVAEVYAEVLGLARVGSEDDFLGLGGDSLLATQVAARLRRVLGVELPVGAIFAAPTVAGLAYLVEDLLIQEVERLPDAEAGPLLSSPRA